MSSLLTSLTGSAGGSWSSVLFPYAIAFCIIAMTDFTVLSLARRSRRFIPVISGLVGSAIGLVCILNLRVMMSWHIYGAGAVGGRALILFGLPFSMVDFILEIFTNLDRNVLIIVYSIIFILDWFFWGVMIGLLSKVVYPKVVQNKMKNGPDN